MKGVYLSEIPNILNEWDYDKNDRLDPNKLLSSSKLKVWWKCKKGHSWQAIISNRARLGRSCPYCAHQLPIIGETDLLSQYPEVCSELHPTKNGDLDPSKIMPGTHKEAWFICPKCGKEYKRRIYHRIIGLACPECSIKFIKQGVNDFATKHPELLKEWDYKKNNISPNEVSSNSGKEVWWVCQNGHEYKKRIVRRTYGAGCPECNKIMRTSFPEQALYYYVKLCYPDAINGYKDIFKHGMELDVYIPSLKIGIEYDGLNWHNTDVALNREKRKYEICKKNNIYLLRIREKQYDNKVDTCDSIVVLKNVKKEYDSSLNIGIRKVLIKLINLSKINLNNEINYNCPCDVDIERDRRKIQTFLYTIKNSLAEYRPDLINEWDFNKNTPLTPYNVKPYSKDKVWWKCLKCGNEWVAAIKERAVGDKTNCPKCAYIIGAEKHHLYVLNEKGSIANTNPELLKKWSYILNKEKPTEVVAGSNKKYWWHCEVCGYDWQATLNHMSKRNSKCPVCSNRKCVTGINDVATKYPKLMLDWDYEKNTLNPKNTVSGAKRIFWKCHICNYEWNALLNTRIKGTGCPNCARIRNSIVRKNKKI